MLERRNQRLVGLLQGRDVNRCGDHVVAGLSEIHVIVGVHELAAPLPAQQFSRPVGDDFVDIHVGRGAGACLEDVHGELIVQLPVDHLLRGPLDRLGDLGVQELQFRVDARGGPLHQSQRTDHGAR